MTFGSATATPRGSTNIDGLSVATTREVLVNRKRATHPAVDVAFTIGNEFSNVRAIDIQLKDAYGNNIAERTLFDLIVYDDATGAALATGGSTGIAINTGLLIDTVIAKLYFRVQTLATGLATFTWTDTGTESVALGVVLPNGNIIVSSAFANT